MVEQQGKIQKISDQHIEDIKKALDGLKDYLGECTVTKLKSGINHQHKSLVILERNLLELLIPIPCGQRCLYYNTIDNTTIAVLTYANGMKILSGSAQKRKGDVKNQHVGRILALINTFTKSARKPNAIVILGEE